MLYCVVLCVYESFRWCSGLAGGCLFDFRSCCLMFSCLFLLVRLVYGGGLCMTRGFLVCCGVLVLFWICALAVATCFWVVGDFLGFWLI